MMGPTPAHEAVVKFNRCKHCLECTVGSPILAVLYVSLGRPWDWLPHHTCSITVGATFATDRCVIRRSETTISNIPSPPPKAEPSASEHPAINKLTIRRHRPRSQDE